MTVQIIPPGAETSEQYHKSSAWGSTLVSTFLSSPRLAYEIHSGRYQPPVTAAMRFGTRFHALMDPGDGFASRYQVGPDADRRTTVWKMAEAAATAAGHELIPLDEWDQLHRMADSVRANPYARALLDGAQHEVGFRMDAPCGRFRVQCRADVLQPGHVADLKTTADLADFSTSVFTYGYHRQAAWYRWLIGEAGTGQTLPAFTFVVIEKSAPLYRCRVIDLSDEFLAIGRSEIDAALADLSERIRTNDWSDRADHAVLEPPVWLRRA